MKKPIIPLDQNSLAIAAKSIASIDEDFAWTLARHGPPPLWAREEGFVTLVRIILEQQVSLVSADAMFQRLKKNISPITPRTVIASGEPFFRSFGVTRQKAAYFVNLAHAVDSGNLDLDELRTAGDDRAIEMLVAVKGIGQWTAKVYLLMALRRPDIWPVGDVALATAYKNLKNLTLRPSQPELDEIALAWRPNRATAARMLWHYYLGGMQEKRGNH